MSLERDFKKIIKISSLAIFFAVIAFFGFFGARSIILGVKITGVSLKNGALLHDNVLTVTGQAKNAVKLSLNGREISIDQDGNFNETIALLPGYNIVSIAAEDKFGYHDEKNYQLINS